MNRETKVWTDDFARAQTLSTTPGQNGWTIADTSSAGAPTYAIAGQDGGALVLTCANDTEVENLCAYHNDILWLDLASIQSIEYLAKVGSVGATTVVVLGIATGRADDEDTITVSAWFKIEGAASTSAVVVETDDGTTDKNDIATGKTLAAAYKKLVIDFSNGLRDVRFYIDGERVAAGTTFDMSAITAGQNVQPYIQLEKGATAGTPSVTISRVRITYRDVNV